MISPLTPEEAIERTSDLVECIEFPVPVEFQAKMAAFMLIVTDTLNSDCPCDVCTRTREIFENVT